MAPRPEQSPAHPRHRPTDLHAHQFALQRAVGALAMRDPDPTSSPLRRIGGALFASVMLAVLAVAAVGIYGLLRPGSGAAWRDGRSIIIEKESGARFILVDGTVHPVLNHASAMLILGTDATVQVTRADLVDIPRGAPVGIPGAPDPLPGRDHLLAGPWTLCSRRTATPAAGAPSATVIAESVLRVGWAPGTPALRTAGPQDTDGVLAVDPNGGLHLLWNQRRFALRDPGLVLAAFAWPATSATPVPAAVLNAIPAGPDLGPPSTPRGDAPSAVPGLRVGEVFTVSNPDGGRLYGIALANGVRLITEVQAVLLVADEANGGSAARELSPAVYATARQLAPLIPTGDDAPPPEIPTQVRPGEQGGICATFAAASALPALAVVDALAPVAGELPTARGAGVALHADHIAVPPGRGVVVESLASATSDSGSLAVVTDLGLRFAVPSAQVLAMLGYGGVAPVRLPASLVALVPAGPALDPATAVLPAP